MADISRPCARARPWVCERASAYVPRACAYGRAACERARACACERARVCVGDLRRPPRPGPHTVSLSGHDSGQSAHSPARHVGCDVGGAVRQSAAAGQCACAVVAGAVRVCVVRRAAHRWRVGRCLHRSASGRPGWARSLRAPCRRISAQPAAQLVPNGRPMPDQRLPKTCPTVVRDCGEL